MVNVMRNKCANNVSAAMKETRALSVRQPWAWLIVHGFKGIENRNWRTNFRGRILVHAAKSMTKDEYKVAVDVCAQVAKKGTIPNEFRLPEFNDLLRGGIVGAVDIVDCVSRSESPWFFGKYGFVLESAEVLPFKPCKGKLSFFTPDL